MVLSLSISHIFSCVGNLAPGLSLRLCSLSFVVISSAAPASFSVSRRCGGGDSAVCVLFPPSRVYTLSWVVLSGVYVAYSVFRLLSSVPPVSCTCFAALDGFVAVVRCCSACRLALSIAFPCRREGLGFYFGSPVLA